MKILQQKRNMNRVKAIMFGVKVRRGSMGIVPSLFKTLSILSIDSFRSVVGTALRVALIYPLRLISAAVRMVKKALGMKVKDLLRSKVNDLIESDVIYEILMHLQSTLLAPT